MIPNTPFLFSPAATASWPARKSWATPSPTPGPSLPNLEALRVYGDQTVPVADTSQREYSEFERSDQPLSTVLETWARGSGATLYVKDWHLIAELESHSQPASSIYSPPPCFRDDWLSPPFDRPGATDVPAATADFRFVYLGPAGTFTPLHRDVYASYSWSANVVGRKVWWLFPPGVEAELKDARGELEFDIRSVPRAAQRGIKILQEEGEVLFVPSGWHHQVVNVDFVRPPPVNSADDSVSPSTTISSPHPPWHASTLRSGRARAVSRRPSPTSSLTSVRVSRTRK